MLAIQGPSVLSCLPPSFTAPLWSRAVIFLRAHTGKPPGRAYLSPAPLQTFPGFGKSSVSPTLISPCVNQEASGAHQRAWVPPPPQHSTQPHRSDGDTAEPNHQQKPLPVASLFLDLGRRTADLGGRSLGINCCFASQEGV